MNPAPIAVGLLLIATGARTLPAQEDSTVPLTVRIVPTGFTDTGTRALSLTGPMQHFSVVVTNTGKSTIRLWRESCSWGYANLSFEAQDQDGAKVAVTKKPRGWEKNFPDWMLIPPGDHLVMEVAFDAATWRNSPLPKPSQQKLVSLRAVYESAADKEAKANQVWSGKVVSPNNTYTIFR